jgi:hypothetical protein
MTGTSTYEGCRASSHTDTSAGSGFGSSPTGPQQSAPDKIYADWVRCLENIRRRPDLNIEVVDTSRHERLRIGSGKVAWGVGPPATHLWAFACGRGAQEKTFAELKAEFALDVVATKHYAANSAWQQLSILAHNLIRNFQLETLATRKPRSRKHLRLSVSQHADLALSAHRARAASRASTAVRSCAWRATLRPNNSLPRSLAHSPVD